MPDLDMSPYGPFVWGAYAISALVLLGLVAAIWRNARAARQALDRAEQNR